MNNRPVGLWMLPAHVGTSRSALAALQRDFAQLRALEHPYIARLLELGCNGQQYYVTGERLDGESLRDVLTHLLPERLEVGEADDILRAIGSALVYAHDHGVVHGDVRAENVLVTMDRRFVLTNFLARRLAKASARPPRPIDDLVGLARLAAELYTGSTSPNALRAAAHSGVPAARLNAIRAVLDAPANRRSGSVQQFLAAAQLAYPTAAAAPASAARVKTAARPWSLWRLVLPMAVAIAIGTLVASYHAAGNDWHDSAADMQRRGLDALRSVTNRLTPPPLPADRAADRTADVAPAQTPASAPARTPAEAPPEAPAPVDLVPAASSAAATVAPSPTETIIETVGEPVDDPAPAQPTSPAPSLEPAAAPPPATTAARRGDPAVLSLGVPRIAAREDHSVVAIDVVRTGDLSREVDVGWWTSPGTADEDDDYAGGRRMVTLPPGQNSERLLIPIVNDGKREADEVFTVHLSRPRNGATGKVTSTRVTLLDDD